MNLYSRAFVALAITLLVGVALLHLAVLAGVSMAWRAIVALGLLGWASGMIFAIAYHVMPVFLAREFPPTAPRAIHLILFGAAGTWLLIALLIQQTPAIALGYALFGASGICFVFNLTRLFFAGTPRAGGGPPMPFPEQRAVDRAAIQATRFAPLGLVGAPLLLAAVTAGWLPSSWYLAGEHWIVLGWLLPMIMGVAYHILPRLSLKQVQPVWGVRWQLVIHLLALPCVVIGLGASIPPLFTVGAALGGISLLSFLWLIRPTLIIFQPPVLPPHHIAIREVLP